MWKILEFTLYMTFMIVPEITNSELDIGLDFLLSLKGEFLGYFIFSEIFQNGNFREKMLIKNSRYSP